MILELSEWQARYEAAKDDYDAKITEFEKYQDQYDGKLQPERGAETETIYNFTLELIESTIDTGIPQPKVTARVPSEKNDALARIAENMIKSELKRLDFDVINDMDERITKIMGGDVGLPEWDNSKKTHDTTGAVEFRLIEPTQFIPQEGVYERDKMDYLFLVFNDTKSRLEKRYNVILDSESVDLEIDPNADLTDELVTQVICYYRNDKGFIGCVSWVGDTVLIDDDEYQARGEQICTRCGKAKVIGQTVCDCGNNKYKKRNLRFEELTEDIVRSDGTVIPAMSPARDENGNYAYREIPVQKKEQGPEGYYQPVYNRVFDENMNVIGEEPVIELQQETYEEPTKIPYYIPRHFPVCIRQNISKRRSVIGVSDCEVIYKQQDNANKIATRMIDKLYSQGSILTKPKTLNFTFKNGIQILEVNDPTQVGLINKYDMAFDTQADMNAINEMYFWAKSLLGVNDTSQGKSDTTATSGKAKELQISRALGRQASKVTMKSAFYSDIFRTIFEFMLAYSDEPRSFPYQTDEGEITEMQFNRYDYLEQDEYGNWFYNDNFEFEVDSNATSSEDRQNLLDLMQADFSAGLYGNQQEPETMLAFWQDRDLYGYPGAKRQIARWQKKVEEAKQAQQQVMIQQEMMQTEAPQQEEGEIVDQM